MKLSTGIIINVDHIRSVPSFDLESGRDVQVVWDNGDCLFVTPEDARKIQSILLRRHERESRL